MSEDISIEKIKQDFRTAYSYWSKWLQSAKEDFEFALGKQWKDEDVATLEDQGVMALTINKIRPSIWLLTGIESQNRTDWTAFPEGSEDSLVAEVGTRLTKNIAKNSGVNFKISQMFEDSLMCGAGWLEPYVDYTYDLLNGDMKFKKLDYNQVFPDPSFKEYDLSDAGYICKVTYGLTKDQLVTLYPESEKKIETISKGTILGLLPDGVGSVEREQRGWRGAKGSVHEQQEEVTYDILEYYYKKLVPVYHVLDKKAGKVTVTSDLEAAKKYVEGAKALGDNEVKYVKRMIPEIWVCTLVGEVEISRERSWSYPKWKSYPIVPNFCYWTPVPLNSESRDLAVQGLTRGMKDLNRQYNKRKTQELRHLNQSTNSGWLSEDNVWVNTEEVKKFGSSAGVLLEYKQGRTPPQKIIPTPLSQGHAQLAAENSQDIKESSGINADLLAMQEGGQASGRAISLRQRQGLVMVQKVFDNLSQTKWIIGRFILSQLSSVFDLSSATRVLGEAFVTENFSVPVGVNPDGSPMMQIDQNKLIETVTKVLQDASLGKFDVAIGESATNETVKFANYTTLLDMQKSGVPIPPEVLLEESQISAASKAKIKQSIEQQQMAMMGVPPNGGVAPSQTEQQ